MVLPGGVVLTVVFRTSQMGRSDSNTMRYLGTGAELGPGERYLHPGSASIASTATAE